MKQEGIGGYFEMELPDYGGFLHDDGVLLNSGRNALEYILRSLPFVNHLWIPYYTCNVILEPIKKLGIPFSFYRIDERLEILDTIDLRVGEFLLYTNYFGIKDRYVQVLADRFGERLIVDNAQAWFADPIPGVSTIYSPRKYVGIPDGGIAYCPSGIDINRFERDYSFDKCSHLLKRIDLGPADGYPDFRNNSRSLVDQPIRRMSRLTERMLRSIDFDGVRKKRKTNYQLLSENLEKVNLFCAPAFSSFTCPMVYPFLTDDYSLKTRLIDNAVFVATYWPSICKSDRYEIDFKMAKQLIPLPIDQRYGEKEMLNIMKIVNY